jgi:hypothetical protein
MAPQAIVYKVFLSRQMIAENQTERQAAKEKAWVRWLCDADFLFCPDPKG